MKVQSFSKSQCSRVVTLVAAGNLCRAIVIEQLVTVEIVSRY